MRTFTCGRCGETISVDVDLERSAHTIGRTLLQHKQTCRARSRDGKETFFGMREFSKIDRDDKT